MENVEKTKICLLQKILSSVIGVFYLVIFVVCFIASVSSVRALGILWVLPAAVLILPHIFIVIKKEQSYKYLFITTLFDFLMGVSPFIFLKFDIGADVFFDTPFMIPLIISLTEFAVILYKIFFSVE